MYREHGVAETAYLGHANKDYLPPSLTILVGNLLRAMSQFHQRRSGEGYSDVVPGSQARRQKAMAPTTFDNYDVFDLLPRSVPGHCLVGSGNTFSISKDQFDLRTCAVAYRGNIPHSLHHIRVARP